VQPLQDEQAIQDEFILVFGSDLPRSSCDGAGGDLAGMGFMVEIKEDFSKLRVKVIHDL
jgi:hypothetical protein